MKKKTLFSCEVGLCQVRLNLSEISLNQTSENFKKSKIPFWVKRTLSTFLFNPDLIFSESKSTRSSVFSSFPVLGSIWPDAGSISSRPNLACNAMKATSRQSEILYFTSLLHQSSCISYEIMFSQKSLNLSETNEAWSGVHPNVPFIACTLVT